MSEHWKEIDLTPEQETQPVNPSGMDLLETDVEPSLAARIRPYLGPALVIGSFVLVAPIGYGFAVLAAVGVAAIFYLTRQRDGSETEKRLP